ncbi:MAG: YbbR family protein [Myxococcales bacterium]|nr:YbbR family protein [Myxococcales bacterium]
MRSRSETIGSLGRAPARQSKGPPPGTPLPPRIPQPPDRGFGKWLRGALLDNLGLKFLSMVLAVTVFLLVNTDRDREISARVGVSYTLPDDKVLVSDRLDEVRVTIKGPWQRLRKFDEREMDRINLDLRHAPAGDIAITPDMIHLPAGLTVATISPRTVHIAFDRRVEKVVEVTPSVAGHPQHGYLVTGVKAVPATIKVRGAEGTLVALSAVRTREISVEGRAESFVSETETVLPDGVELEGSPQIVLHVAVDEELVTRKLPGLAVMVRSDGIDPTKWTVKPGQVEVTLTGALLAVEKAKAALVPVIKLAGGDLRSREIDVIIEGVPPGIGVRISPERVRVLPTPKIP